MSEYSWRAEDKASAEQSRVAERDRGWERLNGAPDDGPERTAKAKQPKWIPTSLSGKGVRCDVVERADGRFVDEWGQVWEGKPGVG